MAHMYTYGVSYTRMDRALTILGKVIGIGLLTAVGAVLGYVLAMRVIAYQVDHVYCHDADNGGVVCINREENSTSK